MKNCIALLVAVLAGCTTENEGVAIEAPPPQSCVKPETGSCRNLYVDGSGTPNPNGGALVRAVCGDTTYSFGFDGSLVAIVRGGRYAAACGAEGDRYAYQIEDYGDSGRVWCYDTRNGIAVDCVAG